MMSGKFVRSEIRDLAAMVAAGTVLVAVLRMGERAA